MKSRKIKMLSLMLGLSCLIASAPCTSTYAATKDTNSKIELSNTKQKVLSDKNEIQQYAKKHNLPLESNGQKIEKIILNTDTKAEKDINNSKNNSKNNTDSLLESKSVGDTCIIKTPYEGYNTERIAWSTSGTGPCTLSDTISQETSSEIFGEFTGKTEVVEAKVGFKIGKRTTCTSSYSVNVPDGQHKRIVGYFRYKGYFVDYYTWGGLNYVGTYEVGRPIGIDFIVYS